MKSPTGVIPKPSDILPAKVMQVEDVTWGKATFLNQFENKCEYTHCLLVISAVPVPNAFIIR
jgi:hypothetical protein